MLPNVLRKRRSLHPFAAPHPIRPGRITIPTSIYMQIQTFFLLTFLHQFRAQMQVYIYRRVHPFNAYILLTYQKVPFSDELCASFNHKIGKLARHNFSGEQEN